MPVLPNKARAAAGPVGQPAGLCVLFVEDDEADGYLIGRALSDNPAVAMKLVSAAAPAVNMIRFIGLSSLPEQSRST